MFVKTIKIKKKKKKNFRHVSLLRSRLGCSHAKGSLRDSGPSGCSWGDSYVKGVGMLIVSPRGVKFRILVSSRADGLI